MAKHHARKRSEKAGMVPGAAIAVSSNPPSQDKTWITLIRYNNGSHTELKDVAVDQLTVDPDSTDITWINVELALFGISWFTLEYYQTEPSSISTSASDADKIAASEKSPYTTNAVWAKKMGIAPARVLTVIHSIETVLAALRSTRIGNSINSPVTSLSKSCPV